jgi:hypothetical protein
MALPRGGRAPVDAVDLPKEFAMQALALKEAGVPVAHSRRLGHRFLFHAKTSIRWEMVGYRISARGGMRAKRFEKG